MATKEFKLPDVGEGVAEGELVTWHVSPGDTVTEDQVVAEVETDKALVEVPSPYDGTVKELFADEGEVVPVGNVIISFEVEVEGEDAPAEADADTTEMAESDTVEAEAENEPPEAESAATSDSGRVFAPPSVRRLARELGVDLATVDGSGPSGRVTEGDVRTAAERGGDAADTGDDGGSSGPREVSVGGNRSAVSKRGEGGGGDAGDGSASAATPASGATPAGRDRTLAAPATRKLADEQGVNLDDVPATEERDGEAFVTPEAVTEYAEAQRAAQEADAAAVSAEASGESAPEPRDVSASAESSTAAASTDATEAASSADAKATTADEPAPGDRVPYRGVRKAIGEAMERSKYTAPHVTHHDTAVVDDLVALREELKPVAAERGSKLTYMPFVMKACVAALKQFPYVNAQLDEEAGEIVLRDEYNVGVATATDAGLMVPVVDDADSKGMVQLADEMRGLVEKARNRTISLSEMRGGTFTITNVGGIGGEYATPIINYPEVAILALGAIEDRAVVEDGEVVARKTLPVSLSIDHRVIDGAMAAEFTNTVIDYLENPKLLLLDA